MTKTTNERAISQARLQLVSICELVATYDAARETTDGKFMAAVETIQENALAVSVRSDWQVPGSQFEAAEYQILLCWGGPSVRIIGDLDGEQPTTARLEYQDWFTPWEELPTSAEERGALIEYARFFYFGS